MSVFVVAVGDSEFSRVSVPDINVSSPSLNVQELKENLVSVLFAAGLDSVPLEEGVDDGAPLVDMESLDHSSVFLDRFSNTILVRPAAKTKYGMKHGVRRSVKRLA